MAPSALESRDQEVQVLGFGLPLDEFPAEPAEPSGFLRGKGKRLRFPHAIADVCNSRGVTLRERRMLDFVNKVTDKPEWERKVFDDSIVAKWRKEACVWSEELQDDYLSSTMFEHCIEELCDKAAHYEESRVVCILDSELAVAKSDVIASADLAHSLRECARELEDVPDNARDWHPGSDQKVLDLLHPSLFPLIYGRSKALPSGTVPLDGCETFACKGDPVGAIGDNRTWGAKDFWGDTRTLKAWGSFQWLPSDIHFTENGSAQLTSYVNNLPYNSHKELYRVLEKFVTASIPLWNECLSWFDDHRRYGEVFGSAEDFKLPEGVTYSGGSNEANQGGGPDSDDSDYRQWYNDNKVLIQLEPQPFKSRHSWKSEPQHRPVDLRKDFGDTGLQVIFKLANIYLTPENPAYAGGSWHIEGALNEHICATALYYYAEDNISESRLAFRQSNDSMGVGMPHPRGEFESTELFYGVKNEEPAIQVLGSVLTRPGRLLAFPNSLQHQVQPFKLTDPSKPGHRKILAMFLVDPHLRIPSTANVPPQQKDWWASELLKIERFSSLPPEIFNLIMDFVEFPLGWDDAVEIRQELMGERGFLEAQVNDHLNDDVFYFCEH